MQVVFSVIVWNVIFIKSSRVDATFLYGATNSKGIIYTLKLA